MDSPADAPCLAQRIIRTKASFRFEFELLHLTRLLGPFCLCESSLHDHDFTADKRVKATAFGLQQSGESVAKSLHIGIRHWDFLWGHAEPIGNSIGQLNREPCYLGQTFATQTPSDELLATD
jgi:hypothetical protein